MKQYYPEAEMCIEVTINNINNETQEDINMAAKNTANNNTVAAPATPTTPDTPAKEEKAVALEGVSVSFDWKNIYNSAKEHLANGYAKGKMWAKEHPKHTAIGLGALALAALLKLRSKKSDNKK